MTETVVLQRIRNRIVEYLELASCFDDQREYQARSPVHVPNEVINQWEDWVRDPNDFAPPVFSAAECDAIKRYHAIWEDVANTTPVPLPSLEDCMHMPQWQRLREAALDALTVFRVRGRLSENVECALEPR
ncbi:MAG: hypothetical protein R3B13_16795 [Polyangiaceae bacterium]